MPYTLVQAGLSDLDFVKELHKGSNFALIDSKWGWDEQRHTNEMMDSIKSGNCSILFMEQTPAGYIEVVSSEDKVNITEIHLVKAFRGQGIGRSVIRQIIDSASKVGKSTTIGCFKENKGAFSLYRSLGFEVYEETETHYLLRYKEVEQNL